MSSIDLSQLEVLLSSVIDLIEKGKLEGEKGALQQFEKYIETFLAMEAFPFSQWPINWRRKHFPFFKTLQNNPSLTKKLVSILDKKSEDVVEKAMREAILFLRLGLLFYGEDAKDKAAIELVKTLVKQYPKNPDFQLFYGLALSRKGGHKKAIPYIKKAMAGEKNPEHYLTDLLDIETKYLESLFEKREYGLADSFLTEVQDYYHQHFPGPEWVLVHRQLLLFKSRLDDFRQVGAQLEKVNEIVLEKTEKERRRLVEVLGIFAAILAFIITNAKIAFTFSPIEAFWLMLVMADILLIFAITLSFLFQRLSDKPFFQRKRFWVLSGLLGFLFILGLGIHFTADDEDKKGSIGKVEPAKIEKAPMIEKKKESKTIEKVEENKPKFRKLFIPKEEG